MLPNPEVQTVAVIPAFNEERTVGNATRAALRADTVDAVVCVNDGSTDATTISANKAAIKEHSLGNETPFEIYLHGENQGKAEAMQTGVEVAKEIGGDALRTVVFLDADLSAIRSRETPYNRYWHETVIDRFLGREVEDFEDTEANEIQEELLDVLAGYIDQLVKPVHTEEKIMTIGLLARNQLADRFRGKLDWGMLAGSRAVSIDLWDAMVEECTERGIEIRGWEVEAALNSYTRLRRDENGVKLNRGIGKLLMTNVVHVGSRYKAGGLLAGIRRMAKIHGTAARSFAKYAIKL